MLFICLPHRKIRQLIRLHGEQSVTRHKTWIALQNQDKNIQNEKTWHEFLLFQFHKVLLNMKNKFLRANNLSQMKCNKTFSESNAAKMFLKVPKSSGNINLSWKYAQKTSFFIWGQHRQCKWSIWCTFIIQTLELMLESM